MTLSEIIERLDKADPSNEREMVYLDCDIHAEFTIIPKGYIRGSSSGRYLMAHGKSGRTWSEKVPPYTSSVDAAIALAEKVLPGWAWKVGTCCVSDDAWVTPDFNSPIHGDRLKREFPDLKAGSVFDAGVDIDLRPSGRPAIALCIAVLSALKAKQMGVGE